MGLFITDTFFKCILLATLNAAIVYKGCRRLFTIELINVMIKCINRIEFYPLVLKNGCAVFDIFQALLC